MVFNNSILLGAAGQSGTPTFDPTLIGNSVWLNGSDEDINRTGFTLSSDGQKEFIISMWVNFNEFGRAQQLFIIGNPTGITSFNDGTQSTLNADHTITLSIGNGGSSGGQIKTNRLFRDIGWYHLLFSFNSNTSVTSKNRLQLYVNGIRESSLATDTAVPDNQDVRGSLTGNVDLRFGRNTHPALGYFYKGYYAQVCYLEGKSIQAGDFAVSDFLDTFTLGTNGSQFIPKKNSEIAALATTAGGNSACLDFADSSDLGNDISSNNKDFTATNMVGSTNQSESTPSNTYATWNPIFGLFAGHAHTATLTEGNLRLSSSTSNYSVTTSTLAMPAGSGKFAAKFTVNTLGGIYPVIGVYDMDGDTSAAFTGSSSSVGLRMDGQRYLDGNSASYGSAVSAGNTVEVELDMDNNTVEFLINGSAQGTISKTFTGTVVFMVQDGSNGSAIDVTAEFDYTPDDANFKNLNTENLTAPEYQGIDYFDSTLYEGNGAGQRVGDFVPYTDLYAVDNSIIFDSGTKNHLQRTMSAAASDSNKKFTLSAWAKRVSITDTYAFALLESTDSGGGNAAGIRLYSQSSATSVYYFQLYAQGSGVTGGNVNVSTVMSAVQLSSWQHFFIQVDTTQSTASDRVKLYIDGVLQEVDNSGGSAAVYPDQDAVFYLGDNDFATQIGKIPYAAAYNSMYIAEHAFLTGTNSTGKTISDFGALDTATNKWVPKDISGFTFGHNGHYLEFQTTPGSGNGAGTDTSGNNNHFAEAINNSASAWSSYTSYQTIDAPSKNYAVYDTVKGAVYTAMSMSEGNLTTKSGNGSIALAQGFPIQDGYWYYEVNFVEDVDNMAFGLYNPATTVTASDTNPSLTAIRNSGIVSLIQNNGASNSIGLSTSDTGLSNPSAGDVVGIYVRKVKNTYGMWFSLNGTAMNNTPAANATATADIDFSASIELVPAAHYTNAGTKEAKTNFGQLLQFDGGATSFNAASDGYWKHAPVAGFKALNQDNLDDTASKLTAWAWIKNRDADDSHILVDRVRGVGEVLHSDATDLEATEPNTVQRFLQRGVQIGNDVQVNTVNESYVLWQWLVGEAATTTTINASSTTPTNSIASTVAAADAGHFSVVGYQGNSTNGATVAHSLGGAPELIFFRGREGSGASSFLWRVFSTTGGAGKYLRLNDSTALQDDTAYLNNTLPGSVVFTLGTDGDVNNSSYTYVAYCFRSVPGVCKIGTYEGNNDANGPYITTGFKVAATITKPVDASGSWMILDDKREPENPVQKRLFPNSNATEDVDGDQMDFYADGFKLRKSGGHNGTGTYLYLAMADIGGKGTLPPIYGR